MLLRSFFSSTRHPFCSGLDAQLYIGRRFCTDNREPINEVWKKNYRWTNPVPFTPGSQPPTALQWVKRRGPTVHHGHLRSLFRKGLIKMFLPATSQVKTVTERTQLIVGDQILIPREVSDLKPDPDYSKTLDITTPAAARLMQQLVASVLYEDDDMFIINKPQGVAVQGGPSIDLSLDQVMPAALGYDFPEPPRLVHRLDKDATGCLVIARSVDAAAWLSLAFAQHAKSVADALPYSGATVQRQYMAIVQQSPYLKSNPKGTITEPLVGRAGSAVPASTTYSTLETNEYFALLQLQLKTGRKHQLRIHCANALSAPIVGDAKHGLTRSPEQRRLLKDLQALRQTEPQQAEVLHKDKPAAKKQQQHKQDKFKHHTSSAALYDDPSEGRSELGWTDSALLLQLHAQTICVQKPEAAAIIVEAKPVGQMRLLLRHFSWMPRLTE